MSVRSAERLRGQFMAGDEDQEYVDDQHDSHLFPLNTIVNQDPALVPFLDRSCGTAWGRKGSAFLDEPLPWLPDMGPS